MPDVTVKEPPARCRYLLLKPFYVDDNYIAEGTEIEFNGPPNEEMEPLNEPAKARMTEFLKANGGRTPRVEDITYVAVSNRPREATMPYAIENVPQMPNLPSRNAPVREPAASIVSTPVDVKPKKLMGTIKQENTPIGDHSI